jgi:hypothetical protein
VKRKKPIKPRRTGWKKSPAKPMPREAKKRRTEWLAAHGLYLRQLLISEAER